MLTKNRDIHMVNLVDFWLIFAPVIKVKLKCFFEQVGTLQSNLVISLFFRV